MNQKKFAAVIAVCSVVLGLTACGIHNTNADAVSNASEKKQTATARVDANASASIKGPANAALVNTSTGSRIAVVYFSEPETSQKDSVQGSTEYIGQLIQKQTGADCFRIERSEAYPTAHATLVAAAKVEKTSNARPAIKDTIPDLSQYDVIFLGYPIWWGDMPMPVYTFLDSHDLSGKQVILFSTHGGSGLAGTVENVQRVESGASVQQNAFTVDRDDVVQAESSVLQWLKQLGYK